jgi:hypothetical protein
MIFSCKYCINDTEPSTEQLRKFNFIGNVYMRVNEII